MNSQLASIADASSLLLGLDRKLARVHAEPPALPLVTPNPGPLSSMGEVTRVKNSVAFADAGMGFANERFQSEFHYVPAPICDERPTEGVHGTSSRLIGRAPMLRKK